MGVVACEPGEGATTVLISLAQNLVELLDTNIVLVDANMRHPALHLVFDLPPGPGLANVILEGIPVRDAIYTQPGRKLCVLPAGNAATPECLTGPRISEVLDELAARFDIVLVDTASPQIFPETASLARSVDGVVLVLQAGRARHDRAERCVNILRESGASLLGAVLNRTELEPESSAPQPRGES